VTHAGFTLGLWEKDPVEVAMSGSDIQIRPPGQCANMRDLRAQIDEIDRALVRLLSVRQRYIERAAEIKADRSQVYDEARVLDVLGKVRAEAERNNLSAELAEAVFKELVARSIALEFKAFDAKAGPSDSR
jgi:isochorismate pyruvate lyase